MPRREPVPIESHSGDDSDGLSVHERYVHIFLKFGLIPEFG